MNQLTAERLVRLGTMHEELTKYTHPASGEWRPALVDLFVYDYLNSMYSSDMDDLQPEYLWRKKPAEVMKDILDNNMVFDIEYGAADLYEYLREWLGEKQYLVHCDDLEEDEYQQLMERE